ncbi:hypothetical protein [Indiicoccus explosivorum]|uniref:hypothetical protein n=1 Tax=Indiicoccus explosivorum TaxID=1917864 RepID=UPI0011855319|nr:hypothetical protein [Indiicoccus explosivorum]
MERTSGDVPEVFVLLGFSLEESLVVAGFMRVQRDLCAFGGIYARSAEFMRVQRDLCAFSRIYARSARFMRVRLHPIPAICFKKELNADNFIM